MKFQFKAKIFIVGINPCVKVPFRITDKLTVEKGYIYIRGKIVGYPFQQTLMPVKDSNYRLYVNGPMLKGSGTKLGDAVEFVIEQDFKPRHLETYPLPKALKRKLKEQGLLDTFEKLTASRRKEILRYLNSLKTSESRMRNIVKIVSQLGQTV